VRATPLLGEPPGEEAFGAFGLGEARADQFTLEHIPCGAKGVTGDLLFADDLLTLGDAVQVARADRLFIRLQDLRQNRVGMPPTRREATS
jgi:hypothetical protein